MKVFVVAEGGFTVRITVPKSWREGPADKLIKFVYATYSQKQQGPIDATTHHLEVAKGGGPIQIRPEAILNQIIDHRDTIRIEKGALKQATVRKPSSAKPPKPPTAASAATTKQYKSIAAWNQVNPDAPTQAGGVARTITRRDYKPRREVIDGVEHAYCVRWGCQQRFIVADNGPTSCKYHSMVRIECVLLLLFSTMRCFNRMFAIEIEEQSHSGSAAPTKRQTILRN